MPTLDDALIASFFALEEVQAAKRQIDTKNSGSVYFTVAMTDTIKSVLKESFGLELPVAKTIPMRWIKGDIKSHVDVGTAAFDTTHLMYLTDSPGELVLGGISHPITKGTAYTFPESVRHETVNTGSEPRLLLGPMSEEGFAVGGGETITGAGGTSVYIKQEGGDLQYSSDGTSWDILSTPVTVENTNTGTGIFTVVFETDLNFTSNDDFFICGSSHIQFGSTSLRPDGTRPIITIDGVTGGYPGLITNGVLAADGQSKIYIYNLVVDVTNGSTLDNSGGWIGQQYFGKNVADNFIINCSSTGPISADGGGIIGQRAGSDGSGNLTLIGCSSSGSISSTAGGIVGRRAGYNGGSIVCESCWSTGLIGVNAGGIIGSEASYATITNCYSTNNISDGGGGICGHICGYDGRTVTIANCYSEGTIAANAGGIGGANTGNVSISNCYSLGAMAASTAGGIIGATTSTAFAIANCYVVGSVVGVVGYIIGSSDVIPTDCYSEAKEEAQGDGGLAGTWNAVHTIDILLPGSIWSDTDLVSPYELFVMGYTPYTRANINLVGGTPSINRSASSSVIAGSPTAGAIIQGRSYTILRIADGDPNSYTSITMDPTSGIISTTGTTIPGTYTIYLRNNGSYNITEYELTVTGVPAPAPTPSDSEPCCARPTFRRGPLINNETQTALVAGNTYIGSFRRAGTNISYAQIIAMKKAGASK